MLFSLGCVADQEDGEGLTKDWQRNDWTTADGNNFKKNKIIAIKIQRYILFCENVKTSRKVLQKSVL